VNPPDRLAAALLFCADAATLPVADLSGNYTWNSVMVGGDKTTEGKVYMILGGNSLVYGTCGP
jgi:hypothetical protein